MAEADYRLMTEATGQRIAAALENLVNLGDPVTIAHGGTGANTAAAALTALGGVATTDIVDNLTSTARDKPLSANMGRVLSEKRQLTITAGTHTVIDENDSYVCGKVMVINFKCHATSAIAGSETIAFIEETTIFDCIVPFVVGDEWTVTGIAYGYVSGKSVLANTINNGQYVHVNFTTLLA